MFSESPECQQAKKLNYLVCGKKLDSDLQPTKKAEKVGRTSRDLQYITPDSSNVQTKIWSSATWSSVICHALLNHSHYDCHYMKNSSRFKLSLPHYISLLLTLGQNFKTLSGAAATFISVDWWGNCRDLQYNKPNSSNVHTKIWSSATWSFAICAIESLSLLSPSFEESIEIQAVTS